MGELRLDDIVSFQILCEERLERLYKWSNADDEFANFFYKDYISEINRWIRINNTINKMKKEN